MKAWILGSGGWMPSERRETTSVLVRDGGAALLLDAGTGARRLVDDPRLLEGVDELTVLLTHFHLDHICGLAYLPGLTLVPDIWAPGRWLYGQSSRSLLEPVLSTPWSPFAQERFGAIHELEDGLQTIGRFEVRTRGQRKHWAPTVGVRLWDSLALITDTAFDEATIGFVRGVDHLLHEAWSTSADPIAAEGDATGSDAGRIAAAAAARQLTLIHLNPRLPDHAIVRRDAQVHTRSARLGADGMLLKL